MSRRPRTVAFGIAFGIVLLGASTLARAADDETPAASAEAIEVAGKHFERGVRLFEEGDPKLALVEFERSYAAVPDPRTLYNIGQVQLKLGAFAEARTTLERYLSELGERVPPARREAVQKNLEALALRTAWLTIQVTEPDVEVRLDGALLGRSPVARTLVSSGAHTLLAAKPGFDSERVDLSLVGGDERAITITMRATRAPQVEPRREDRDARPTVTSNPVFWITWGATAGLAAAAVGTTFAWQSASSDLDAARHRVTTRQELDEKASAVETRMALAATFGVATLLAGGTALYFTIRTPARGGATTAISPFGVRGTF